MWTTQFSTFNKQYQPTELVLFRKYTQSECGGANGLAGPHYCPTDEKVYLDETFFIELHDQLGAKGGDVAEAYVIAHEVGHHAQNRLGILGTETMSNRQSIEVELQADCFAGLWAYSIKDQGVLEFLVRLTKRLMPLPLLVTTGFRNERKEKSSPKPGPTAHQLNAFKPSMKATRKDH